MNQLDTALPTGPAAAAPGRTRLTKARLTKSRMTKTRLTKAATIAVLALTLGACNALTRLSQVGQEPPLTAIQNPAVLHGNQPIAMPMPPPMVIDRRPNSLWRPGSRAFLKDQRASEVGDILTVVIEIEDDASISNSTRRSRNADEAASASSLLGYEAQLSNIFPSAIDPTCAAASIGGATTSRLNNVRAATKITRQAVVSR